jgi:hypothetical protein
MFAPPKPEVSCWLTLLIRDLWTKPILQSNVIWFSEWQQTLNLKSNHEFWKWLKIKSQKADFKSHNQITNQIFSYLVSLYVATVRSYFVKSPSIWSAKAMAAVQYHMNESGFPECTDSQQRGTVVFFAFVRQQSSYLRASGERAEPDLCPKDRALGSEREDERAVRPCTCDNR